MGKLIRFVVVLFILSGMSYSQWAQVEITRGKQVVKIEQLVPVNITRVGLSEQQLRLYLESDYIIPAPEQSILPVNRGILRTVSWQKESPYKVVISLDLFVQAIKPSVSRLFENILLEFSGDAFQNILGDLKSYSTYLEAKSPEIASQLNDDYETLLVLPEISLESVSSVQDSISSPKLTLADSLMSKNDSTAVLAFSEEIPNSAIRLDGKNGQKFNLIDLLLSPVALMVMFVLGLGLVLFGIKEWFGIKLFKKKKGVTPVEEGGEGERKKPGKREVKADEGASEPEAESKETSGNLSEEKVKAESSDFNQMLMEAIKEIEQQDSFEPSSEGLKTSREIEKGKKGLPPLKYMDHNIIYQYYLMGYTPEVLSKELKLSLSEIHLALQLAEQSSAIDNDLKEKIFRLSRLGISNDEIARQLKLNVESVNLILWQGEA